MRARERDNSHCAPRLTRRRANAAGNRKAQRLCRLHQPAVGALLQFTLALFQLGRQERPDRQGAHHLRHLHHLRHVRLQEERREGQCAGAARRRARGRRHRLRGGRGQARAAAQGGRRLLHAAGLQGRQDGQGQGPASPSRGRVGLRSRAPTKSCAAASMPSTTNARWRSSPRSSSSEGKQGALPCRGADDPGQARAARARTRTKPDIAEITQALNDYESIVKGGRTVFGLRRRRQDRLVFHRQRQVVPGHGEVS